MHNKFLNHPKVDTESRMIADSELSVIELLLKKDLKLSEKKHQKTPRANYKLEREERKENQSQQTGQYVFRSQMDITRDKRKTQQAQLLESEAASSNPGKPFNDPRIVKDRRVSANPNLIPETGCRRRRERRSTRSAIGTRTWWMLRRYVVSE